MVFSQLLGVKVHRINQAQALQTAVTFLESDTAHYIATVNPEFLMQGVVHPWFRDILNRADLALIDGIGVAWAFEFFDSIPKWVPYMPQRSYRTWLTRWMWLRSIVIFIVHSILQRKRHRQRLSGSDLVEQLLYELPAGCRIYCVGAGRNVAATAQKKLQKLFSHLRFVGAEEGLHYIRRIKDGIQWDEQKNNELCERIRTQEPAVVFVAFGQVKQERWIQQHLFQFPSVRLFMGVGGTLDFIAGGLSRAPLLFRSIGLEWLWRLWLEPRRICRIWTAVVRFPLAVLTQAHQAIELFESSSQ